MAVSFSPSFMSPIILQILVISPFLIITYLAAPCESRLNVLGNAPQSTTIASLSFGWGTKFSFRSCAIYPHLPAVTHTSRNATRSRSSGNMSQAKWSSQRSMGRACFMGSPPPTNLQSPAKNIRAGVCSAASSVSSVLVY
ncbi:hypothetical protein, unlikely [Trypanosoma congolense IL3000]|uniref:Uncharacterized protein n=1 Tax=Trypanosoma congolense (strain IL3000) TaxID=1068625 RepID=F9WHX3_TRYCI|nr:hypothetical protein, unlikely [Trypanosoma congolense IL3000]